MWAPAAQSDIEKSISCLEDVKGGRRLQKLVYYKYTASCYDERPWSYGDVTGDLTGQDGALGGTGLGGRALTTCEVKCWLDSLVNPNPVFMNSHLNNNKIHICTVCWCQLSRKQWVITRCLISKGMRAWQSQKTAKVKWAASSLHATTWSKGIRNRLKGLAKQKQIVSALNFLSKSLCSGTFCIKAVLTVLSIKAPMPSKILSVA